MAEPTKTRLQRPPARPSRARSTARTVGDLLGETDALAAVRAGARQAAALERDLAAILPEYLAPHVTVGTIKGEMLTLFAGHSALAARLRHLERGLVQELQRRGWPVGGFKVKVQPAVANEPTVKQARVSPMGVACLRDLAGALEPSPLRDALERMVTRHGGIVRK
ncbi:MAG TPA: DciA family protein [Pararobbsia sp.]|jgi:hypothetical protein|nr:DciA family protein [Pararobbsia sp.]